MYLSGFILQILYLVQCTIAADDEKLLTFPKGFMFGAATSAYQIEGAWNVSGKGLSIWDQYTHEKPDHIKDHSNGDVASDSYHKYKEDNDIAKNIGLDHMRMSISWTRILPNGFSDNISAEGIQHYKDVLDDMKAKGIEPFVTMFHEDLPYNFELMGGWLNDLIIEYFADYARILYRELGSRVKFWTTINEPDILCKNAYGNGLNPPGLSLPGKGPLICAHNVLKAHARAYRIYDQEFRKVQKGKVGIVITIEHHIPLTPEDSACTNIGFQFYSGWITNAIFSKTGDYPKIMKDRIGENSRLEGRSESRLPVFSPSWIRYIRGTADYYGLNQYTAKMCKIVPRTNKTQKWFDDSGIELTENEGWRGTQAIWLKVVPEGMRGALNSIKSEYNNPPVYILENGIPTNETYYDYMRIDYLYSYMEQMLLAIHLDGCDVRAHTVWSLLDTFEWDSGYTDNFGLVSVNFSSPNLERSPRLSSKWLNNLIKSRKLTKNCD